MWGISGEGETLRWTHGEISIVGDGYRVSGDELCVTCLPFADGNANTLVLDIKGEEDKGMVMVKKIMDFYVQKRAVRSTRVNLKGGGLLLDVAGFASSIYMRGMHNVTYIPTTLLAMVDATVGGKTGINFADAKNIVGTVRHPKKIVIDIGTLESLSDSEFKNGLAEVIKMAVTYDLTFFQYLEQVDLNALRKAENRDRLKHIIKKSLELKIKVVEKDQFQLNERKWLNFGHTIGHGIELSAGHSLLHGECVAIGMMVVLEMAEQLQLAKTKTILPRLKKLLESVGLPTKMPQGVDCSEVVSLMMKDKKKSDSSQHIEFVLIKDIGQPEHKVTKVPLDQVIGFFAKSIQIGRLNPNPRVNQSFPFPSSKSISLRLAYISALSVIKFGKSITVINFLESDDTKWMLLSLQGLGFEIEHDQAKRILSVKSYKAKEKGTLNIGNSGITARIILPLCATLKGQWTIECHPRMLERPNKEIIKLCESQFNCIFHFPLKPYSFPLTLTVKQTQLGMKDDCLWIDGNQSSQFITSVMIYSSFFQRKVEILTRGGTLVSQSYLLMTAQCLEQLKISTVFKSGKITLDSQNCQHLDQLHVQTDLSSLSYPYLFSMFHNIAAPCLPTNSIQGDLLFYKYLHQLTNNKSPSLRLDFNDCTDTFMTLAVFIISPIIQSSPLQSLAIFNIANQRIKESNRIHLIIKNLQQIGVKVEEYENQIRISKEWTMPDRKVFIFETGGDHRLAMSLAVMSTYLKKVHPDRSYIIDDKKAVEKTFPQFWDYLHQAGVETIPRFAKQVLQVPVLKGVVIIGDRGSGKTTLGRQLSNQLNLPFVDLDEKITEELRSMGQQSITSLVQKHGWSAFRQLQSKLLQHYIDQPLVLSTGAGVVENKINYMTLQRSQGLKVYIQREFEDLRIDVAPHRPEIANYKEVAKRRGPLYEELASVIVNVPMRMSMEEEGKLVSSSISRYFTQQPMKEGIILSLNEVPRSLKQLPIQADISSVQLRVDSLLQNGTAFKQLRKKVALFHHNNHIQTLLTLRTKEELGTFTGNYLSTQDLVRKIPTHFLDHQFVSPINYPYNPSKLVLSYHGQNTNTIKRLIALPDFQGIKKLCFRGTHEKWQEYYGQLGERSICMNLDEPVSRLQNRYQFAVLAQPTPNITGIMSLKQMSVLNSMRKVLFKR